LAALSRQLVVKPDSSRSSNDTLKRPSPLNNAQGSSGVQDKRTKTEDQRSLSNHQIQAQGTQVQRIESAARELCDPSSEPTDTRVGELTEITFGEHLHLRILPSKDVVRGIREFHINIGQGGNFAESAVFQEFMSATVQWETVQEEDPATDTDFLAAGIRLKGWLKYGSEGDYRPDPSLAILTQEDVAGIRDLMPLFEGDRGYLQTSLKHG
jgi:hypothetical protein